MPGFWWSYLVVPSFLQDGELQQPRLKHQGALGGSHWQRAKISSKLGKQHHQRWKNIRGSNWWTTSPWYRNLEVWAVLVGKTRRERCNYSARLKSQTLAFVILFLPHPPSVIVLHPISGLESIFSRYCGFPAHSILKVKSMITYYHYMWYWPIPDILQEGRKWKVRVGWHPEWDDVGPPSPVSILIGVISVSLHSVKIGVLTETGPKGKLKPFLL